ncbi:MAG: peptidase S9, partial [Bacteroidales bacterium]|nr:peptidase S9 [Bacteroidales bacterium]
MRRYSALVLIVIFIFSMSCSRETPVSREKATTIINRLTEEEKAGGVMTPEIMWKFGRLGSFTLSPDGSTVLYTVTNIDLASEARQTNIFSIPSRGGEAVQLTDEGGHSPGWFSNGSRIAFVSGSELFTMNPDGSDKQKVIEMSDFESFSISPAGNRILFTRRVKLDQTAGEKHNLPKAKVRIIDDLMYRHWNAWSDYSYSHLFVASFDGKRVSDEKDIMEGQKFESPLAPYFDEGEISWSPDGKYIAYTTKRLTGKEYARSTNSDIFLYELSSGKETNISAGNSGFDRYPVFSPDGSRIAYQSMARDGYESDLDRLFVYDIGTGSRTWITREWDYNVENICWADNQNIFFTSPFLGSTQIFSVNTSERKVVKLTEGVFDLGPFNISGGVLVSGLVSMSMAPELALVDMASGKVDQIT